MKNSPDDYREEIEEDLPFLENPIGNEANLGKKTSLEPRHFVVSVDATTNRLDKVLSELIPEVSRARVQEWIRSGAVSVNGEVVSDVRAKTGATDAIDVTPMPSAEECAFEPEADIDFRVVYEDDAVIIIDKPAGLVVHPAAGHWSGTLLNGLLYRYPELRSVSRAGIVHRLDRETSGLMVVARTEDARTALVRDLQTHAVCREYWAIVLGIPPEKGFVDTPIGRDPRNPIRFSCRGIAAKPAKTHVRLVETTYIANRALSWVACRLETGRTHQIRVHLTSVGLPLLGDPLYRTNASKLPEEAGLAAKFSRQALHASRLMFTHPVTGKTVGWFSPPPEDMREVMEELQFTPTDEPVHVFD